MAGSAPGWRQAPGGMPGRSIGGPPGRHRSARRSRPYFLPHLTPSLPALPASIPKQLVMAARSQSHGLLAGVPPAWPAMAAAGNPLTALAFLLARGWRVFGSACCNAPGLVRRPEVRPGPGHAMLCAGCEPHKLCTSGAWPIAVDGEKGAPVCFSITGTGIAADGVCAE